MDKNEQSKSPENKIELQVVTTSGNYPTGEEFREYNAHQKLSAVLHQAERELKLQGTEAWVAKAGERKLDANLTIAENGLTDRTQIYWAPVEAGGGACIRN